MFELYAKDQRCRLTTRCSRATQQGAYEMANRGHIGLSLFAPILLAGCMSAPSGKAAGLEDDSFGLAFKQTMSAQIINPSPVYNTALVTSGEHAADAVARYRAGTVKRPDRMGTSKLQGDSGGSSDGGASASPGQSPSNGSNDSSDSPKIVSAPKPAIDLNTGKLLMPVANGAIEPTTGDFYQSVPNGYINTKNGEFTPKVP